MMRSGVTEMIKICCRFRRMETIIAIRTTSQVFIVVNWRIWRSRRSKVALLLLLLLMFMSRSSWRSRQRTKLILIDSWRQVDHVWVNWIAVKINTYWLLRLVHWLRLLRVLLRLLRRGSRHSLIVYWVNLNDRDVLILVFSSRIWIGMDSRVSSQLIWSWKTFVTTRECTRVRFLARMSSDVSSLVLQTVESFITHWTFVRTVAIRAFALEGGFLGIHHTMGNKGNLCDNRRKRGSVCVCVSVKNATKTGKEANKYKCCWLVIMRSRFYALKGAKGSEKGIITKT